MDTGAPGAWDFKNMNTNSPTFNSTFNMAMLNGSEPHIIKDFKMSVSAGHASTSLGNLTNVVTRYWHSDRNHEGHAYNQCTNFHKPNGPCYESVDRYN